MPVLDLYFGEGYMAGTLDVVCDDLGDALTALYVGLRDRAGDHWLPRHRWPGAASAPSLARARDNVHRITTSAMPSTACGSTTPCSTRAPTTTRLPGRWNRRQAKMEPVCVLRLRPGERAIEAGCGWGRWRALHGPGRWARARLQHLDRADCLRVGEAAARDGLSDRVEFVEADYRSIDGTCDAFVSVGMLEHVGLGHYDGLGALMQRSWRRRTGGDCRTSSAAATARRSRRSAAASSPGRIRRRCPRPSAACWNRTGSP
ncbi:MAG: class I SAM-dependent methyltransferase [Vicinamibacterales bacterium]